MLQRPLTVRGQTDRVVFCTGQTRPGDALPDWRSHAQAGTTLVFYMAMGRAGEISQNLQDGGIPATTPVTVTANVSKPTQTIVETNLSDLHRDIAAAQIKGCGLLLISLPKDLRVAHAAASVLPVFHVLNA